jgi:CDP-diglyceride synthetase
MPTDSFFEWLTKTPWAKALNGPEWAFPAVESLHFIGMALSLGTIAIVDLRLLGIAMRRHSASELAADLHRWTLIGLTLMLITGSMMFSADAVNYHHNPAFQFKMLCLSLALVFYFTLHRSATDSATPSHLAKLAGAVSLALWICVVAGGRMIAFV